MTDEENDKLLDGALALLARVTQLTKDTTKKEMSELLASSVSFVECVTDVIKNKKSIPLS